MKLRNFHFRSSAVLLVADQSIDLHNDFEFAGFRYEQASHDLVLEWRRAEGEWVRAGLPERIHLAFRMALLMRFQSGKEPRDAAGRITSFVGFLHPDDVNTMDGSLEEAEADDSFHFIVGFEDGAAVKVHAEEVTADLGPEKQVGAAGDNTSTYEDGHRSRR